MRLFMLMAAFLAAFFIGGCVTAPVKKSEWNVGERLPSPFICKEVDPIVRFGKADVQEAADIIQTAFQEGKCGATPQMAFLLEEHILTFAGVDENGEPTDFEVWRIKSSEGDYYMGIYTYQEAVKRGYQRQSAGLQV